MKVEDVLKEREKSYGSFKSQCKITQGIKEVMFATPNWDELSPSMKESLGMIALKIGRILNGDPLHMDSWVDIAGFSQLIVEELEPSEPCRYIDSSGACDNIKIGSELCRETKNNSLCSEYSKLVACKYLKAGDVCSNLSISSDHCMHLDDNSLCGGFVP